MSIKLREQFTHGRARRPLSHRELHALASCYMSIAPDLPGPAAYQLATQTPPRLARRRIRDGLR